jgi:hypothetical protein
MLSPDYSIRHVDESVIDKPGPIEFDGGWLHITGLPIFSVFFQFYFPWGGMAWLGEGKKARDFDGGGIVVSLFQAGRDERHDHVFGRVNGDDSSGGVWRQVVDSVHLDFNPDFILGELERFVSQFSTGFVFVLGFDSDHDLCWYCWF